jgi:uncharacterized phage-associated protein
MASMALDSTGVEPDLRRLLPVSRWGSEVGQGYMRKFSVERAILQALRVSRLRVGQPTVRVRLSVSDRLALTFAFEVAGCQIQHIDRNTVSCRELCRYAMSMPSVHDVARYILQKRGSMSTWKLQKLVYYSQAWHYVWEDEQLFSEPVQAWADGPVVPVLFKEHRGKYTISTSTYKQGSLRNLTASQRGSIDAVLGFYGDKSGHWLSELTHKEAPWKDARSGLGKNERGHKEIELEALGRYYAPLDGNVPLEI